MLTVVQWMEEAALSKLGGFGIWSSSQIQQEISLRPRVQCRFANLVVERAMEDVAAI